MYVRKIFNYFLFSATFLFNGRGNRFLWIDGRKHRVKRLNKNNSSLWSCANPHCTGSATWSDTHERIVRLVGHTCAQDHDAFKRDEIISELRRVATICTQPLKSTIEDCLNQYRSHPEYENVVPTFDQVKGACYRARSKNLPIYHD